jgi:plastocyanin
MRSLTIFCGFFAAGLVIAACNYGEPRAVRAAEERPAATVDMTDRFDPARVTVRVGQTVEWTNSSEMVHTVTADPEKAADRDNVRLPEAAQTFDSGDIEPGETFRHTFTVPGSYRYVCLPHEDQGMIGEVEVRPAAAPAY